MLTSIISLALLLYPAVVHACIVYEIPQYAVLYLSIILMLLMFEKVSINVRYLVVFLSPLIAYMVLRYESISRMALYILPVLVCMIFFRVFARTLVTGEIPLVTRMAKITQGRDLDEDVVRYTRGLTGVWALVFLGLAIESTLLAFFASFELWSLFTNVINYMIVVLVFVGDYLVRRRTLASWRNQGFKHFIDSITKVKIRDLK